MNVTLATVTNYNSTQELRFKLACETIENAVKSGREIAVVDGSPNPEVPNSFRALGAKVFAQAHKGLGPAKRQSFFHALELHKERDPSNEGVILAVEAEKDLTKYIPDIVQKAGYSARSIIVPCRTEETLRTWPAFQQETETRANNSFNAVLTEICRERKMFIDVMLWIDIMFGPVAFRTCREVSNFYITQNPGRWGFRDQYAQHLGTLLALIAGEHVVSLPIGYTYPETQRLEEEGALFDEMKKKRIDQLNSITDGYREVARCFRDFLRSFESSQHI